MYTGQVGVRHIEMHRAESLVPERGDSEVEVTIGC
jgi:hypothetical protein